MSCLLHRRKYGERHSVRSVVWQRCERGMIACRGSVGGVEHGELVELRLGVVRVVLEQLHLQVGLPSEILEEA